MSGSGWKKEPMNDKPEFPILKTKRLILRKLRPLDAEDVLVFRGDPVVQKYDDPVIDSIEEALEFIKALDDEYRTHVPPRHSDYRDKLPEPFENIQEEYARFVTHGQWTFGMLDMWCPKSKVVKHSVHVPCWDSFKILPWKWRGCVFGRNCKECYWFGLREARWARTAYGGNLGREYVLPVRGVGTHGYKSEIEALCWLTWILFRFPLSKTTFSIYFSQKQTL